MKTYEFRAMSTGILMGADGADREVEAGFRAAHAFIVDSEKRFTRFSEQSELSAFNRSGGTWFSASPDLFEVMAEAVRLYARSGGLFDPAVLEALERAGYDRDIEEVRLHSGPHITGWIGVSALPSTEKQPVLPLEAKFSEVGLDIENYRVFLPAGMRIDLGGIAKGWIAEQAALRLAQHTDACIVDAGGDMFMVGLPVGEPAWRVALEDPQDPARNVAVLNLGPGAVATSSITRRRWTQAGQPRHHLIDPRTGQPADTQWLSVTVIAPHAVDAEVYAKSLLIGGALEADRIAELDDQIEYIAVDFQNQLWGSKHSREVLHV